MMSILLHYVCPAKTECHHIISSSDIGDDLAQGVRYNRYINHQSTSMGLRVTSCIHCKGRKGRTPDM